MNKRGLSGIVTTVLLIIIAIALVVIIWNPIQKVVDQRKDVNKTVSELTNLQKLICDSNAREICNDGIDNNCNGLVDVAEATQCGGQIVAWFHARDQDSSNIAEIGKSGFVTHVIIANVDFDWLAPKVSEDEQVGFDEFGVESKIDIVRQNEMTPIWSRRLWFTSGDSSTSELAKPFLTDYTNNDILYNADYYEWFLKTLWAEADYYNIDLVAIDAEPYGPSDGNGLRDVFDSDTVDWDRVDGAVNEALSRPGVKPANYIFPADKYKQTDKSGFVSLGGLGLNKISEATYTYCKAVLDWSATRDIQMIGIWPTVDSNCYAPLTSGACQQRPLCSKNTGAK